MPVIHIPNSAPMEDISSVNEYLQSDNPSFVLLYMDGCGPCSQTHPQWKKMEKKFSGDEAVGIFDIEMSNLDNINHKNLTKDLVGFPTMRYVKGNNCEDYENCDGITTDRSYNSFLDWIDKKQGNKNVMIMGGGKRKRKSKSKKNKKTRSKKQKGGKEDFGTYKDGSSVFKDKNGYYIDEWDNDKQVIYKKYLKSWKPVISDTRLILDKKTKKWKIVKSKKTKSKKKSKKKTRKSKKKSNKKSKKRSRKSKKAGSKKTSNLQAAEDDIIGLTTDGIADGAAVAAV